jgi:hypothetical protein
MIPVTSTLHDSCHKHPTWFLSHAPYMIPATRTLHDSCHIHPTPVTCTLLQSHEPYMIPVKRTLHDSCQTHSKWFLSQAPYMIAVTCTLHDSCHKHPTWFLSQAPYMIPVTSTLHDSCLKHPTWSLSHVPYMIPVTSTLHDCCHMHPTWFLSHAPYMIPVTFTLHNSRHMHPTQTSHSHSFLSSLILILSGSRYNLWSYTFCSFLQFPFIFSHKILQTDQHCSQSQFTVFHQSKTNCHKQIYKNQRSMSSDPIDLCYRGTEAGEKCLNNFAYNLQLPWYIIRFFNMLQTCNMGQMALLPFWRKACWGFFDRKIWRLQPGANPRSWVTEASMLTTRPPKPLTSMDTLVSGFDQKCFWTLCLHTVHQCTWI